MALHLFTRPKTCATCGTPVDEGALEAHGRLFHSALCLRKYERDAVMQSKKKREGGGSGGCHCC